jgi:hypothetical protein
MSEQSIDDPLEEIRANNAIVIDYLVIAKVIDDDGDVCLQIGQTDGLSGWEALGMMDFAAAIWRNRMLGNSE